ncbi:ribonucleotide-diphosphate reductase subunit beta [Bacillus cereus]|uniref:ribonucleotide-diphosphate reductase subunit beta n=1 Tax=Bacillus cereus group TaxID=86661 RepID=UPI00254A48CF|nr:ribonucleotide-diphosphate reductase subunit beta [Bacillus cereus]MDK7480975.1 ribonucleotide-diphosphate reductase subunit beta [Bacillus cereus]
MTLLERKIYDVTAPNKSTGIINGSSSNILNWNDVRFPWAYKMYKNMMANFWVPEEINMSQDILDFEKLSEAEKFAFKRIIGLLAFLDSVQTDFSKKVADYLTDSSLSALMTILAFQEVVHNQSYSYVLSSLVSEAEQKEIFEYWKNDPVLLERNEFIAKGYERFAADPTPQTLFEAIVLDVILEGLYFYAGFAFFYNLARDQKMLATSRMINYINKDEQIHVYLFTNILKELVAEFPELDTPENRQFVTDTVREAAELEIKWGEYIIGDRFENIDMTELTAYVKFIANKRVKQMGYEKPYEGYNENPMRWIKVYENPNEAKQDFFEGKSRQYAKAIDNGIDDL